MSKLRTLLNSLTTRRTQRFNHLEYLQSLKGIEAHKLELLQLNRLENLLNHAEQHVPYYRDILQAAPHGSDGLISLTSTAQLRNLPILTKALIRANKDRLLSENHQSRSPYRNTSGGSTGKPIVVTQDREYFEWDMAQTLFVNHWRGATPFDSQAVIWGADRDTYAGKKSWDVYIRDFVRNRITLNSFNMGDEDMKSFLSVLDHMHPRLIHAYSKSLLELAKFGKRNGISIRPQQAIHATADTLHDFERKTIESYFGCKVYNHYGNREVGAIASECGEAPGLHVMMMHNHVEILGDDGNPVFPGQEGEVVITNLSNFSMPLIRYAVGDRAVLAESDNCPCGWNFPKLKSILGRTVDVFITKEGKRIDGIYFQHALYFVEKIDTYQVIQEDYDTVTYKIIPFEPLNQAELEKIEKDTQLVMGNTCTVNVEYVEKIEKSPTGKRRYIISNVTE